MATYPVNFKKCPGCGVVCNINFFKNCPRCKVTEDEKSDFKECPVCGIMYDRVGLKCPNGCHSKNLIIKKIDADWPYPQNTEGYFWDNGGERRKGILLYYRENLPYEYMALINGSFPLFQNFKPIASWEPEPEEWVCYYIPHGFPSITIVPFKRLKYPRELIIFKYDPELRIDRPIEEIKSDPLYVEWRPE